MSTLFFNLQSLLLLLHKKFALLTIFFFHSRRLIGRRFDDPTVKKDIESWPFTVIEGGKGEPLVQVEYLGETKTFTPPQISAMVLGKVCFALSLCTVASLRQR